MPAIVARTIRSMTTLPDAAGWRDAALIGLVTILAIALVAAGTGMLSYPPRFDPSLLSVFVIPALTEEVVFRGPLPSRGESTRPILWLTASVVLFTLWHVVEALTFLPGASLFLTPGFLLSAAALGTACALIRYRTASLWPAVALHGIVVFAWLTLFGGPSAAVLMRG